MNRWSHLHFTCTDCEWAASGVDEEPKPPSKRAIEHHVDNGHHVERVGTAIPLLTRGSRFRIE